LVDWKRAKRKIIDDFRNNLIHHIFQERILQKVLLYKLIILAVMVSFLSTSDAGTWKIAKYGGEFTSIGVGARALAMGGAYSALASDVTAGYWNPAGLVVVNYPELTAMHAERFAGVVNYDYFGLAYPLGLKSTIALNVTRTGVDDIPFTKLLNPNVVEYEYYYENNRKIQNVPYAYKMVNDAEWAWYLSFAYNKLKNLSYGASAKFVRKGVGEYSGWGLGFDVGVRWNPVKSLFLGANLQDATTTLLAWNTGKRELILPTLKCGSAYIFDIQLLKGRIAAAADIDFRFEGRKIASQAHWGRTSADFHFGLEYEFQKIVALRFGLDVGHPTAGLGVHLPKLDVDYAFLSHAELGTTHRISLRLTIEEEKFKRH
jgi:hypothetical protein